MPPYVGEIRLFAGNFAPNGWMFCNGAQLPISENDVLFQLIGTTYGGDGEVSFNLPNLQSRLPVHMGNSSASGRTFQIGEMAGVESVTLTAQQVPVHSHALVVSRAVATESSPAGNVIAQSTVADLFMEDVASAALATSSVGPVGGSQPHENLQPFLCLNYIISLFGIFPSQT